MELISDEVQWVKCNDDHVIAVKMEKDMTIVVQDKNIHGKARIGIYLYVRDGGQYLYTDGSNNAIQVGLIIQKLGLRFHWQIKNNLRDFLRNIFSKFYIVKITK